MKCFGIYDSGFQFVLCCQNTPKLGNQTAYSYRDPKLGDNGEWVKTGDLPTVSTLLPGENGGFFCSREKEPAFWRNNHRVTKRYKFFGVCIVGGTNQPTYMLVTNHQLRMVMEPSRPLTAVWAPWYLAGVLGSVCLGDDNLITHITHETNQLYGAYIGYVGIGVHPTIPWNFNPHKRSTIKKDNHHFPNYIAINKNMSCNLMLKLYHPSETKNI